MKVHEAIVGIECHQIMLIGQKFLVASILFCCCWHWQLDKATVTSESTDVDGLSSGD